MATTDQAAKVPSQTDHAVFAADPKQTFASLTQAGEIVSRTATAVWEKQAAFVRHESLQAVKVLSSLSIHRDPGAAASAYLDVLHQGIERAIDDARQINDLVRESAWQVITLYAGLLGSRGASKPTER